MTETTTPDNTVALSQIVIDGLKKGAAKSVILTELIRTDSMMDLIKAGALYNKVGKENNLLLSKDDKDKLVITVGAKHSAGEVFDRDAAVSELAIQAHMSKAAATTRLKEYCKANTIDFPTTAHTQRDMTAVNTAYKKWFEDGTEKAGIIAGLVKHFGYTEKNAPSAYTKIGKALGLISGASGRDEMAVWFANPENVKGEKKDVIARLSAATGIAAATADVRYGMYLFAMAYVKAISPPVEETQEAA